MEGYLNSSAPRPDLPEVRGLGITPGNPFAPFVIGTVAVSGLAVVILLGLTLFAPEIDTRYNAGLVLLFVGALAPIPAAILVIYSRNYVRIQRMQAGDYWAHWTYPVETRRGNEVMLGQSGIYWPDRRKLVDFKSGLVEVEQMPDELIFRYIYRRYSKSATYTERKEERVPIPYNKVDEAGELVQRYRKILGVPSDFINDSWVVAWIMGGVMLAVVLLSILLVLPLESTRNQIKNDAWATQYSATRVVETAMLERAFAPVQRVLEPQFAALKAAGARTYQPEELGFKAGDNVREVIVGFCVPSEAFYVLVWQKQPVIDGFLGSVGVYHYVEGDWGYGCIPPLWQPDGLRTITEDWNYVFLKANRSALATAFALELQKLGTPTAAP